MFGLLFVSHQVLCDCDKSWLYKPFSLSTLQSYPYLSLSRFLPTGTDGKPIRVQTDARAPYLPMGAFVLQLLTMRKAR